MLIGNLLSFKSLRAEHNATLPLTKPSSRIVSSYGFSFTETLPFAFKPVSIKIRGALHGDQYNLEGACPECGIVRKTKKDPQARRQSSRLPHNKTRKEYQCRQCLI